MTISDPHEALISPRGYPWLAAGLSWLLPGAGHVYGGACLRGIVCFLLFGLLGTVLGLWLISGHLADSLATGISFLIPKFFRAAAAADAFRTTRRLHGVNVESMREPAQRGYFPVFLTAIVPGLGQLYERRWHSYTGFLFLSLYLWLVPVSLTSLVGKAGILIPRSFAFLSPYLWFVPVSITSLVARMGVLILQSLACAHAFLVSASEKASRSRRTAWLVAGLVAATLAGSYTLRATRRSFLVENLIWNSNSMMPTVPHGSHCIADMLTYRYRDPEIGDIILFISPKTTLDGAKDNGIRLSRIVARGGETVHVRTGVIFVDGEHRDPAGAARLHSFISPEVADREASWLPYGVTEPYRVPEGCYFVLSDDRTTGDDSRYYGPVPRKDIIGRITRIYWRPGRIHPAQLPMRVHQQSSDPEIVTPRGTGSQGSDHRLRDAPGLERQLRKVVP